jgi:amino acid transporter
MSAIHESSDPEKGTHPSEKRHSDVEPGITQIVAGGLLDERYEITHRGLKSRHAQMIALGGTIGTG